MGGGVTVHPPIFAVIDVSLRVPHAKGAAAVNGTTLSGVTATNLLDAVLLNETLLQENGTGINSDIDLEKDKDLAMLYKASYYPWYGSQVVYHPSGHTVVHHPSGHTEVYHPSGHTVVHHPWGGVTVRPPIFAAINVSLRVPHAESAAAVNGTTVSGVTATSLLDAVWLNETL